MTYKHIFNTSIIGTYRVHLCKLKHVKVDELHELNVNSLMFEMVSFHE